MHCLIEHQLWQGNAHEARDIRSVLNLGVKAIIDLAAEEEPVAYPRDIVVLRYPIIDGEGNPLWLLEAIVNSLGEFLKNKIPTLVFCTAGLSRSPAFCAISLARLRSISTEEAIESVRGDRVLDVSTMLWRDLRLLKS